MIFLFFLLKSSLLFPESGAVNILGAFVFFLFCFRSTNFIISSAACRAAVPSRNETLLSAHCCLADLYPSFSSRRLTTNGRLSCSVQIGAIRVIPYGSSHCPISARSFAKPTVGVSVITDSKNAPLRVSAITKSATEKRAGRS